MLNSVGIEDEEAGSVLFKFIKELLKTLQEDLFAANQQLDENDPVVKNMKHLWNFFQINGGSMIQELFNAILQVPSRHLAEIFTDTIGVLCVTFMDDQ